MTSNEVVTVREKRLAGVQLEGRAGFRTRGKAKKKPPIANISSSGSSSRIAGVVTLTSIDRAKRELRRRRRRGENGSQSSQDLGEKLVQAASGESGQLNDLLRDDFKVIVIMLVIPVMR